MRTDGSGKIIKIPSSEQQENLKNTRKTLKVLQQAACDKENLVGRVQRSGKDITNKAKQSDSTPHSEHKVRKLIQKGTQTSKYAPVIDAADLTSEAGPSENYWEVLAEKRREALDESLNENIKLLEENVALKEENRIIKEMLDESKNLVEVLTEMLNESDTSTLNDTTNIVDTSQEATEATEDE